MADRVVLVDAAAKADEVVTVVATVEVEVLWAEVQGSDAAISG